MSSYSYTHPFHHAAEWNMGFHQHGPSPPALKITQGTIKIRGSLTASDSAMVKRGNEIQGVTAGEIAQGDLDIMGDTEAHGKADVEDGNKFRTQSTSKSG